MNIHRTQEAEQGGPGSRVLAIGVGSGGAQAVGRMREGWDEGPVCMAVDTDAAVLARAAVDERIEIGCTMARGEGTGGDPKIGVTAAEDEFVRLAGLVDGADLVFLVSCLGGGTGSGAAPVVARAAREAGALVVSFVTIPFSFEGDARQQLARRGIRDLGHYADAQVVLPNDRLLDMAGEEESARAAFAASDAILGTAVLSIWRLLTRPGLLNLNLADVRRLLEQSGGTCSLGYGSGTGSRKAYQALEDLLENPLLERGTQLTKASALLVSIVGGEDLTLGEIQRVTEGIRDVAPRHASYVVGAGIEPAARDTLTVTVLIAEQWVGAPAPAAAPGRPLEMGEPREAGAQEEESLATSPRRGRSKRGDKRRELQNRLSADSGSKDRFKDVAPTLHRGQDLDAPTFLRKGVKLTGDARG